MSIKIWTGHNFETGEDLKQNKVIIKESVIFYNECGVDIFKEMKDEEEKIED